MTTVATEVARSLRVAPIAATPVEVPTTVSEFVGGFTAVPHPPGEVTLAGVEGFNIAYERLTSNEKVRALDKAKKGITEKFRVSTVASSNVMTHEEVLASVDSLKRFMVSNKELREVLHSVNVHPAFMVHQVRGQEVLSMEEHPPSNMLLDTSSITMKRVKLSLQHYASFGSVEQRQRIFDSYTIVFQSCTGDLKAELEAAMEQHSMDPELNHSGPMLYFYLRRKLQASTQMALRAMTQNLASIRLVDYEGENVLKGCSDFLLYAQHLRSFDMCPHDIDSLFKLFLLTASNSDFRNSVNNRVEAYEVQMETDGVFGLHLPMEDLYEYAIHKYQVMVSSGQWLPLTVQRPQNFNVNGAPNTSFDLPRIPARQRGQNDYTPPRAGEVTRVIRGREHSWCGQCNFWFDLARPDAHDTAGCNPEVQLVNRPEGRSARRHRNQRRAQNRGRPAANQSLHQGAPQGQVRGQQNQRAAGGRGSGGRGAGRGGGRNGGGRQGQGRGRLPTSQTAGTAMHFSFTPLIL